MSTITEKAFKASITKIFPNSKPSVFLDDDGNIESATVFVTQKITSVECQETDIVADNHELDFAIRSTGASQGLVIEFNK